MVEPYTDQWLQPVIARSPYEIKTTEMNVGGDPLRVVTSGYPETQGDTLREKYRFAQERLDQIRRALFLEPRGHQDMWGAITVEPDDKDADIAAFYLNANGYSPMCGHASIGLARFAVDAGLVKATSHETSVNIQLPCGLVRTHVEYDSETKASGRTHFTSIPSFLYEQDLEVNIPRIGKVVVDVSFGGIFFAITSSSQLGIDVCDSSIQDIKYVGVSITKATNDAIRVEHPTCQGTNLISGTIITDGKDSQDADSTTNICVYSSQGLIARAPCGSGVVARVALQVQKRLTDLNQPMTFKSRYGSSFVVEKTNVEGIEAVRIEVSGQGHYIGRNTFFSEENDEMGKVS
nr:trans-L-3-hydroxyproline dehydratase-like [Lytechinus pictus]